MFTLARGHDFSILYVCITSFSRFKLYVQVIFFPDSDWLDCREAWNSENAQFSTEAFCLLLSYNSLM